MVLKVFKKKENNLNAFFSVANGKLMPITEVADPVFSQKMIGEGVAIIPRDSKIASPCDGKITMIYPTLHAFGVTSNDGIEVIVHIGINTVKLKGRGFKQYVKPGDEVKRGDLIIEFNDNYLKNNGFDWTTMVIFPNIDFHLNIKAKGKVKRGKSIVAEYYNREDKNDKK